MALLLSRHFGRAIVSQRLSPIQTLIHIQPKSSHIAARYLIRGTHVSFVRNFASDGGKWGVINESIHARFVNIVGDDGKMLHKFPIQDALALARKQDMDLVQVSSNDNLVVCKIFDAKKKLFAMKKAGKLNKQKTEKEVNFKANIETHDLEVKLDQAKRFLGKGHKVKLTVKYFYEQPPREKALELIEQSIKSLGEYSTADRVKDQHRGVYALLTPKT